MSIADLFDSTGRDLRLALRTLLRRPAYMSAAVLTLALGIGATTSIFSVVYSVLIKPLPYPNSDELVRIRHPETAVNAVFDWASSNMYLTYRKENRTFANVGLWQEADATLSVLGEPERVRALRVTDGTLQALGVTPLRGRWFTEAEHGAEDQSPAPVILSYAFAQRRFGGDAVVGRELSLDAPRGNGTLPLPTAAQVVGVMPPDFRFLDATPPPDIIIPVRLDPARQAHGVYSWQMLARLKPGVTLAEARADLERMRPIWLDAWPPFPGTSKEQVENLRIAPVASPLQDDMVRGVASMLWVLMGAIGAVLVIACANIANLMLVRADARRTEFTVRAALGATPSRVAREMLVESFVIGLAGALLGLLLANGGLHVLVAMGPDNLPRLHEIAVHPQVLGFTVAVSLASTLMFGSITALKQSLHADAPMSGAARGASAGRERNATRNTLVVVQVALALILVVSSALMIRTFQALRDVDAGFSDPATIQTARIWVPTLEFPEPKQYTRMEHEILDRIATLPGVSSAGFASELPMESSGNNGPISVDGETPPAGQPFRGRKWKFISPGYLEAMGTRILAGRDVAWSDLEAGGRVAIVSEALAREIAGEPAAALGKRIRLAPFARDDWHEVIGVVQDVHHNGLSVTAPDTVYWPALTENMFSQPSVGTPSITLAIRSARAGTIGLIEEVRHAVRATSASIPVGAERTMQDYYGESFGRTSFALVLLAIAGAMALSLGVIGIYGVIAYVVQQKTREIGIRSALGARPEQLTRLFLVRGLALSGVGALVGLVAAATLGQLMSSLLFGVRPLDATAFGVALAVTATAAALACYVPARRAAAIDPIETLKVE